MLVTGDARTVDVRQLFGVRVREFRTKLGITQQELADRSTVDRHYISSIECGQRNLALEHICRIAAALEVDPGLLIAGLPSPGPRSSVIGGVPAYGKKGAV